MPLSNFTTGFCQHRRPKKLTTKKSHQLKNWLQKKTSVRRVITSTSRCHSRSKMLTQPIRMFITVASKKRLQNFSASDFFRSRSNDRASGRSNPQRKRGVGGLRRLQLFDADPLHNPVCVTLQISWRSSLHAIWRKQRSWKPLFPSGRPSAHSRSDACRGPGLISGGMGCSRQL